VIKYLGDAMKTGCKNACNADSLTLRARTAEDLMSENPISLHRDATVYEAIALLVDRDFDAAPVIDENGQPIGVVTVTDILVHDRAYSNYLRSGDVVSHGNARDSVETHSGDLGLVVADCTTVEQIMTPGVFAVQKDTKTTDVVRRMLELKVHHLFVADNMGVLIGVISTCDILRHLA